MKNAIAAAALWCGLALVSAQASSLPFPLTTNVTVSEVSATASGLPGGDVLSVVTDKATNNGPVTLYNVYLILLDVYFWDPGFSADDPATWNNSRQAWTYSSPTLPDAAEWAENGAANVLLSPADTNIPYPPSLSGDTFPPSRLPPNWRPGNPSATPGMKSSRRTSPSS